MHTPLPTLKLGHTLQARYRVREKLGAGGFGAVYLADDLRLRGRRVAIKELSHPSTAACRLFQQEAAVLASLDHPGLVRVSDFFEEQRSHYLVMDYIEGEDLLDLAAEAEQEKRLLPTDRVLDWMLQLCEAVAYLHRQQPPIIHRDIKPNNVRLSTSGRAILVDFGIAKIDPESKTEGMAKAISHGFSPPEQYASGGTNTRSDVYSLGATAYCLLTVLPPPDSFKRLMLGEPLVPPRRLNPDLKKKVETVILKAMSLSCADRYADAAKMLAALQRALGRPVTLPPAPKSSSTPMPTAQPTPSATQTRCARCGSRVRAGARFCPRCGLPLSNDRVRCPHCGAVQRAGARFCSQCRTPLPLSKIT